MKIDLHCHTKKTKAGDPPTRNVSSELFAKKIRDADVKVVGITNHNLFDLQQYRELAAVVKDSCQVWPGVELNICGINTRQWHLIVISDPEEVVSFDKHLKELMKGTTPENCLLNIEEVVKNLETLDCFYIPHYHKSPEIPEEDAKKLLQLVGDDCRILNETSDVRSMGVFANHNHRVIIGSDVRDWSKYENSTFSELRLPVENFQQLYLLAKRDPVVVNTLLNKNESRDLTFTFVDKLTLTLTLYQEVNVIFGSKGTGKSEILKAIQRKLEDDGYNCVDYIGSEKDDRFKQLLSTDEMQRHTAIVGSVACDDDFQVIRFWEDKKPTPILDYIQWLKTKDINVNKKRMKITAAHTPVEPSSSAYLALKEDLKNIQKTLTVLKRVDINQYLDKLDASQLLALFDKLKQTAYKQYLAELIKYNSEKLSKRSIATIKRMADKMTETKSHPGSTGFSSYAANRLKLSSSVKKIKANIVNKENTEKTSIGQLEGKGVIYIEATYRMYSKSKSHAGEFGERKISDIASVYKLIESIDNRAFDEGVYSEVSALATDLENLGINSTEQFLGLSKRIVLEDGIEYQPSNGEKAILIMQGILGMDKDVYIFDEPELGMGNSYIDENIRPKITELGKSRKMVIIATHNANIAVRTLPYASIYREHDNGSYKTYIGNPFLNSISNIDDPTDIKNWKDISMKVLEGGVEAFYERKDIYEARNH